MILNSIDDPRDNLQRATRGELWRFAKAHHVEEINSDSMPADLMRRILRSKNLTQISTPPRPLGIPGATNAAVYEKRAEEVTADDDLARQWASQNVEAMTMPQLRKEAKARGIKQTPKDNKATLIAKLRG